MFRCYTSSILCSCLDHFYAQARKNKKSPPRKTNSYISGDRTFLPQSLLILTLDKTPLEETGCLRNLYCLLPAQASSFLFYQPFPNTVSCSTLGTLLHTVQPFCELWNTMPPHWSPSASHPTFPSEAVHFLRGGKYPKDVPLPTLLAYLKPV